jgi:hypothetical protein
MQQYLPSEIAIFVRDKEAKVSAFVLLGLTFILLPLLQFINDLKIHKIEIHIL